MAAAEPLTRLWESGKLHEAIRALKQKEQHGLCPSSVLGLIPKCISANDLVAGRELNQLVLRSGLHTNDLIGTHLIRMFTSLKCLPEATQAFNSLPDPTVFAYNAIISAHVKLEHSDQAFDFYTKMQKSGIKPNKHIFVPVLRACTNSEMLYQGRQTHSDILRGGIESDAFIEEALICMYVRCGCCLEDALAVFNRSQIHNLKSWYALLSAQTQLGMDQEALQLFKRMQEEAVELDYAIFILVLKVCINVSALGLGRLIHSHINESDLQSRKSLCDTLVDMYAKFGCLTDAQSLFDTLSKKDLVTWSVLISGYAQHGHCEDAFKLISQMEQNGLMPDGVIFVSILKACDRLNISQGMHVHAFVVESGVESNMFVGSSLIGMYINYGSLNDARNVFSRLQKPNLVTWSALIGGYSKHGQGEDALQLFRKMLHAGIQADPVIVTCVLKACSSTEASKEGREFHSYIVETGFNVDAYIGAALINMYAKCGLLQDASAVLETTSNRNVVTWNSLISGYADHGNHVQVLCLFEQMQSKGVKPDERSFLYVLTSCSITGDLCHGQHLHVQVIENEYEQDESVGCCLIDMYAKCDSFEDAYSVFRSLHKVTLVTWNTLVAGYNWRGHNDKALQEFLQEQPGGITPKVSTFLTMLNGGSGRETMGSLK